MNEPNITTDQVAGCLRVLKAADKFMTAAEIAHQIGIGGEHETQRRHIRALVKKLRDNGSMIVANTLDGYWLTEDIAIWKDYNEHRAIDAKVMLAEVSRRKKTLSERKGQGFLFSNRIPAGCATMGAK
jgi:biotin operon repressor